MVEFMRFRNKTILGVALIELTLLSLLIISTLHTMRQSHEAELMRKILLSEKLLVASSKNAVIAHDFAALDNLAKDMLATGQFVYLRFLDEENFVLVQIGEAGVLARPFVADTMLEDVGDDIFDKNLTIDIAGINYGQIQFGVSVQPLKTLLTRTWQRTITIASINMSLVALFSWLLGSYLVKQLSVLQQASQRFSEGDMDYRIKVTGRDELAETALMFNNMIEKLAQSHRQLAVEMSEREKTAQKLSRVNQELARFTTIAAHHLQEPVRRIVSFVQRLKTQVPKQALTEEARISLDFIEQSAVRQRALVQDIQRYLVAEIARGTVTKLAVEPVWDNVQRRYAERIKARQAVITLDRPLPPLMIDAPRLSDVFAILLDNALSYHDPRRALRIHIGAQRKHGRCYYYFSDNGMGIPAEYHERVFQVFERLQVNKDQTQTGIGLAIVRRILESCEGHVSLKQADGGGLSVVLDFPDAG